MKPGLPIVVVAAAILATTARVRTDDPVSSSVRFTGEVVRILNRRCQACHGPDGLAMPLTTYGDVRSWGRAIREEIVEQRMPPWTAARGFGRFRNNLSLSARETLTVLSWLDGGMPRGDDRDLPPAPAAGTVRTPADVRIALAKQRVPAREDLVRRVPVAAAGVDTSRAIARVTLAPGSRRVLRGARIFETRPDGATRWLGAWLPWQHDASPPEGYGFRLTPGAALLVELHYRGGDREVVDEPAVEVSYAAAARAIEEITVKTTAPSRLPRSASVWALVPDAGAGTASLQLTARRPDGSTEVLLWMPRLDPQWPHTLILDRPLALPAGTSLAAAAGSDGSVAQVRVSLLTPSTVVPPSPAHRRDARRADTSAPTRARK